MFEVLRSANLNALNARFLVMALRGKYVENAREDISTLDSRSEEAKEAADCFCGRKSKQAFAFFNLARRKHHLPSFFGCFLLAAYP
jgi:hypothetical protein